MKIDASTASPLVSHTGGFRWAGYLTGVAMGGFFDGILLHQVLQWHHLLSLVDSPVVKDIRVQILADGMFHVLMYLIALWGLTLLWHHRRQFALPSAGRYLLACALLGFGVWNVIDIGLFHWILVIHRIRVDSNHPLFWDLLWLVLFGLPFLVAGWWLRRCAAMARPDKPSSPTAMAVMVTALTLGTGTFAALPPADTGTSLVVFAPGTTPLQVFQAFDAADVRVVWSDQSAMVWAVHADQRSQAIKLYRHRALVVSGSMLGPGCFNWLARS
jgi:uncharacterized membrane protein